MDDPISYAESTLNNVLHVVDAAEANNCDNIFDNVEHLYEDSDRLIDF